MFGIGKYRICFIKNNVMLAVRNLYFVFILDKIEKFFSKYLYIVIMYTIRSIYTSQITVTYVAR